MPLNKRGRPVVAVRLSEPAGHEAMPRQPQQQPAQGRQVEDNVDGAAAAVADSLTYCCVPTACPRYFAEPIDVRDPGDAVRVVCNNVACMEGEWMHSDCFRDWEQQVLVYLRSCGRARSWSEKQRMQNLWTKKGYDLAYRACDCRCTKGHLRKDLNYFPPPRSDAADKKHKKHRRKNDKPMAMLTKGGGSAGMCAGGCTSNPYSSGGPLQSMRPQLRVRTSSFSSTGSSPPSSAGTPPLTPGGGLSARNHFEFFADPEQAAAGNIFRRRKDLTVFNALPRHQQNPYHIKMEDEGPHGNDEIRCFLLTNLSTHQVTAVGCVVCQSRLTIFDKYPLIDGTFFLSPQRYNTDMQVMFDCKLLYLNAVCMRCLEDSLQCLACRTPWSGSCLVIGTMYAYDIFAAMPCCAQRLSCKHCRRTILDPSCGFNFFSEYSRAIRCPFCHVQDYHFIRPLEQSFIVKPDVICK
ncbi:hypothetical protein NP493_149g04014 [Ridgeia piscesae]|uniref:Headcase middle domain-containing protein n=1 Tax=Ridgeia piscesae TaxID=27915 RepID=A0AAD9P4D0_RIDPI|nr:hypothetical protein NP493_149g04014 [Ridgeia piscesae]